MRAARRETGVPSKAVRWLRERDEIDFDALVGSDDDDVIAALEALQERGVRVPEDVALVGYDDKAESRWRT